MQQHHVWKNTFATLDTRTESGGHRILVVRALKGEPDWTEWRQLIAAMSKFIKLSREKGMFYSLVFDLADLVTVPYDMLLEWKALFVEKKTLIEECVHSSCVVVGSTLVRKAAQWFLHYYDPVRPFSIENDVEDAVGFVVKHKNPNCLALRNVTTGGTSAALPISTKGAGQSVANKQ